MQTQSGSAHTLRNLTFYYSIVILKLTFKLQVCTILSDIQN